MVNVIMAALITLGLFLLYLGGIILAIGVVTWGVNMLLEKIDER